MDLVTSFLRREATKGVDVRCGQQSLDRAVSQCTGGRHAKISSKLMSESMDDLLSETTLDGVKVLVVEDEAIVAMLLEQMLEDLGCTVAGAASQLSTAINLVSGTDADIAILDMNLAGDRVDPVARILAERAVPFVFASGYGEDGLTAEWRGRPVLPKPFRLEELRQALVKAISRA